MSSASSCNVIYCCAWPIVYTVDSIYHTVNWIFHTLNNINSQTVFKENKHPYIWTNNNAKQCSYCIWYIRRLFCCKSIGSVLLAFFKKLLHRMWMSKYNPIEMDFNGCLLVVLPASEAPDRSWHVFNLGGFHVVCLCSTWLIFSIRDFCLSFI